MEEHNEFKDEDTYLMKVFIFLIIIKPPFLLLRKNFLPDLRESVFYLTDILKTGLKTITVSYDN